MTSISRKPVADAPVQDSHVKTLAKEAPISGPAEALRRLEGRESPTPDAKLTDALSAHPATKVGIPPATNPFEFHDDSLEEELKLKEAQVVFGVVKKHGVSVSSPHIRLPTPQATPPRNPFVQEEEDDDDNLPIHLHELQPMPRRGAMAVLEDLHEPQVSPRHTLFPGIAIPIVPTVRLHASGTNQLDVPGTSQQRTTLSMAYDEEAAARGRQTLAEQSFWKRLQRGVDRYYEHPITMKRIGLHLLIGVAIAGWSTVFLIGLVVSQ